jgi:hypothetical protein
VAYIRKEILINASAAHVWDALRDVGALHTRLVPGFVVRTQLEPGARVIEFFNGSVVRELIVDINDAEQRVAWAIHDPPFQHYNASAQVYAQGDRRARFVWIVDLLPHELRDSIADMMDRGLAAIQSTLDGT